MTSDDINRVMQPGAVLAIDTPLRISIPVKVASNGIVSGEAGALGLTLGAIKDRGRWWTEGDQLCVKWFRWFDAKARCISLQRDGSKVYWQENSGETGTATITEAPTAIVAAPPPKRERVVETAALDGPPPAMALGRGLPTPDFAASPEPPPRKIVRQPEPAKPVVRAPVKAAVAPKVRPAAPRKEQRQAKASIGAVAPAVSRRAPPAQRDEPVTASSSGRTEPSFRVSRVVDGDILNVRNGPSEYHPAVGTIPARGRGVQIVGVCQDLWCPIRHGRLKGWVNRYYLAEDVDRTAASRR
ncbi:MAG: SH3 domain-containing protein [Hyphomicrobium sp.]|jgi:hypothetical protein